MRMSAVRSAIRDAAPWLAVTVLIGGVDYLTPSTYAFASIYFIPIFPAAWRSRAAGFIVAAAIMMFATPKYARRPARS